jgi:RNA binding motif
MPIILDTIRIVADKLQRGELQIHGHSVGTARVLEGEEEKSYWQKFLDFKNRQVQQKADEKFQKRKRNANNGGNYRGNRQQNHNNKRHRR